MCTVCVWVCSIIITGGYRGKEECGKEGERSVGKRERERERKREIERGERGREGEGERDEKILKNENR